VTAEELDESRPLDPKIDRVNKEFLYNLNNSTKEQMNSKTIFSDGWDRTAEGAKLTTQDLIAERAE